MTASRNTVTLAPTERGLRAAAGLLRAGELVAFPTETVYGLGADASSEPATAAIFAAKDRPAHNPLIVHVADLAAAEALAAFPPAARTLAARFWPGPLTLVLPVRTGAPLASPVTAGLGTVALRVPAHPLARRLLEVFAGPIAAPSANPSGRISPTSRAHVLEGLDGRIAAVLDGGACSVGLESSILGLDGESPVLLRPGGIAAETLAEALGRPVTEAASGGPVRAPGQLPSHYAPRAALRLDASGPGPNEAWLGFGPVETLQPSLNLSPTRDLAEAAANLFAHLHTLDALAAETDLGGIAVARIPQTGLGRAINDRLSRAAAPR